MPTIRELAGEASVEQPEDWYEYAMYAEYTGVPMLTVEPNSEAWFNARLAAEQFEDVPF